MANDGDVVMGIDNDGFCVVRCTSKRDTATARRTEVARHYTPMFNGYVMCIIERWQGSGDDSLGARRCVRRGSYDVC